MADPPSVVFGSVPSDTAEVPGSSAGSHIEAPVVGAQSDESPRDVEGDENLSGGSKKPPRLAAKIMLRNFWTDLNEAFTIQCALVKNGVVLNFI